MLITGAAAAAFLASPGLGWCIALAASRRPDPRAVAAVSLAVAMLILWRAADPLHAFALSAVAAAGIVAAWVDAYRRRLPDAVVLPAYPVVAALLLATAEPDSVLRAGLCAGAAVAVFLAAHLAGQLGFGDVKLAGLLGLVLGWSSWQTAVLALLAAVVIGGVQGAAVLALRGKDLPFGPAMLLGAAAALAAAPEIWALFANDDIKN
ncbi:hypothetical protein GCM10027447_19230 [Glycomyces halotolerans]